MSTNTDSDSSSENFRDEDAKAEEIETPGQQDFETNTLLNEKETQAVKPITSEEYGSCMTCTKLFHIKGGHCIDPTCNARGFHFLTVEEVEAEIDEIHKTNPKAEQNCCEKCTIL